MLLHTLLISTFILAPQEFSIERELETPSFIESFGGVGLVINQDAFEEVPMGSEVIIRDFPLGVDSSVDLRLERFDVFTEEAEVVVGRSTANGKFKDSPVARPDIVFLHGSIDRNPDAHVFLAFGEETTNGYITANESTYILTTHPTMDSTFIYNMSSVDPELMNWVDFQCEVERTVLPAKKNQQLARSTLGSCEAIQLAVDTDFEFTGFLFNGNVSASGEYAATLIAAVSTIYKNDIDVWTHISYLRLWDSISDPWSASGTGDQLPQFKDYWQENMSDVPRHLAHLISGRNLGGGRAYVGVVCSPNGYAVSANMNGYFPQPLEDYSYQNWDLMVVAHEQGHNCGTWHTHDYSPPIDGCGDGDCTDAYGGTIMSYCHTCSGGLSNVALEFHYRVQDTMSNFLDSDISCSLECDQFLNGACCFSESCTEVPEGDCDAIGGIFLGTGTLCATGGCEPEQPGACCIGSDGTCTELDANTCLLAEGNFLGLNTTCDLGWCDPDATFACCIESGCEELSNEDCDIAGGQFDGIGTNCEEDCQPLPNDFCETALEVSTGVYNFSTYDAISDNAPVDNSFCVSGYLGEVQSDVWFRYVACESSDLLISTCGLVNFDSDIVVYEGECDEMVQVDCNGDGAGCVGFTSELTMPVTEGETYMIRVGGFNSDSSGYGQIVFGNQQCQPDIPCIGDVNLDDMINVTDVLLVVDHWGESDPQYDINENGTVGLGDLLFIIAAWGNCEV